jgi:hypothetical protein
MKIELNILTPYILIYIIVGIIFIKTIINFFIEYTYPILQNVSPNDKNLIQNMEYITFYLDIPYIVIMFYLVFNIKLNLGIKILFLFSFLSTALKYFLNNKYIYKFIDKKYLNENIINFLDVKVDYTLDIIILLMYLYVLYNF